MSLKVLSPDFLLRKHNMEYYLMQTVEPRLPFLNVLPVAQNDTGEFPTVLKSKTATADMKSGKLGEPLDTTEASELTEVDISPINASLGETDVVGYKLRYSDKFLNRSSAGARLTLALSKIAAGMTIKISSIILQGLVESAAGRIPAGLSNWPGAIDPRADAIKLRHALKGEEGIFQLNEMFISDENYISLEEYYMSMEWPFDSQRINVDGTFFNNVEGAFNDLEDVDFVGFDTRVPPGIIEKYVNPEFSTLRQNELEQQQGQNINVPVSLININQFTEQEYPYNKGFDIWAELGYSSQEPDGVIAGSFKGGEDR
jgi:hypothetical protein